MSQPFWRQHLPAIVIGLTDVFLIGLGMRVPILTIGFGFVVGWWVVRAATAEVAPDSGIPHAAIRSLILAATALAAVSLFVLLAVWGPSAPPAFDPAVDAAELRIPLILYTSQASKIGWLLLMTVVSPALQFMAVVTGGALRLAMRPNRNAGPR